ncbi:abhydrolase [Actinoplanes sp. SE50]|uniref:alpha/beta fold hydrolase n=1 Tax=unclassified Actinoplanes TaxID=2626549 RepID=UPI00023EC4E3|nr:MULTISPECIES: alpha/beta fold hydrolase [unclassified Actinoplanes]AEV86413.1 Abhydrolase domain-containing protein 6 [Actinoplanes sp. SE50/110]ATO84810.1 abhydrolase [Actinoplanes sp. SE50]SLM02220.1 alpha/beta hydrolase [Actinoplanes sp. SE50/110]
MIHDRRGSGAPLLLIHGLGSHWQVWLPLLPLLSPHRDVISVDLPGFGASPPWPPAAVPGPVPRPAPASPDGPGSVRHLADQVEAFLDSLGLDTVEVGGSSMGGGIALELGRRGRARTVTAFSPIGFWPTGGGRWCRFIVTAARAGATALDPLLPRLMATPAGRAALCSIFYAHPGRLDRDESLAAARALAAAPGFAAARSAFRRLTPWAATDPGALPTIPVTIAWGTRDAVLPYRNQALRARTALPAARHVPLPGCGHLPFPDAPAHCADLLLHPAT